MRARRSCRATPRSSTAARCGPGRSTAGCTPPACPGGSVGASVRRRAPTAELRRLAPRCVGCVRAVTRTTSSATRLGAEDLERDGRGRPRRPATRTMASRPQSRPERPISSNRGCRSAATRAASARTDGLEELALEAARPLFVVSLGGRAVSPRGRRGERLADELAAASSAVVRRRLRRCRARPARVRSGWRRRSGTPVAAARARTSAASLSVVAGVALHPLEGVPAALQRAIEALEQLPVQHGSAVGLAPAFALPAGHPLRHRVDHVLAVAEDAQVVVHVGRRLEEVDDRHELALVVRAVRPSAGRPVLVVDVPGPAGRAGVAEGGAVRRRDDRHGQLGNWPRLTCGFGRRMTRSCSARIAAYQRRPRSTLVVAELRRRCRLVTRKPRTTQSMTAIDEERPEREQAVDLEIAGQEGRARSRSA